MNEPVRLGTRGSPLAMWQARETARRLEAAGIASTIVTIRTTGDVRTDVPLAAIGGKGLFVKELEEALLRDAVDLAVHSLKDVPSIIDDAFVLAGFLERADPRDAWLQRDGRSPAELGSGSRVGTSSPRRRAQLRASFPQLDPVDLRGNVGTRIERMRAGELDAIVLASAGLARLGREEEITARFDLAVMVPAAGQGIVAVEALRTNERALAAAEAITHAPSARAALCERGVLAQFGTKLDCYSCIAVHASADGERLRVRAFLSDTEARRVIRIDRSGSSDDELMKDVAGELMEHGALDLLRSSMEKGESS